MGPSGVHCKVTKYLRLWQTISWRLAEYPYLYTDDYGNTTGHDMNGNYYSAYTDDLGYTTVTTY